MKIETDLTSSAEKDSASLYDPLRNRHYFIHSGSSMNPTISEKDIIEVLPYQNKHFQVGDVIAFRSPFNNIFIVHRICSITPEGIYTKGDNCNSIDPWCLSLESIVGQATTSWRNGRKRAIRGGQIGKMIAKISNRFEQLNYKIVSPIYEFCQLITGIAVFRRIFAPFFGHKIIVCFRAPGKRNIIMLLGNKIIGRYDTKMRRWHIRKPYKIFIDETSLPRISEDTRRTNL